MIPPRPSLDRQSLARSPTRAPSGRPTLARPPPRPHPALPRGPVRRTTTHPPEEHPNRPVAASSDPEPEGHPPPIAGQAGESPRTDEARPSPPARSTPDPTRPSERPAKTPPPPSSATPRPTPPRPRRRAGHTPPPLRSPRRLPLEPAGRATAGRPPRPGPFRPDHTSRPRRGPASPRRHPRSDRTSANSRRRDTPSRPTSARRSPSAASRRPTPPGPRYTPRSAPPDGRRSGHESRHCVPSEPCPPPSSARCSCGHCDDWPRVSRGWSWVDRVPEARKRSRRPRPVAWSPEGKPSPPFTGGMDQSCS